MKSTVRPLVFTAVAVGAICLLATFVVSVRHFMWQPMSGGGEIRFRTVTIRGNNSVAFSEPPLRERVKAAWTKKSFEPLRDDPNPRVAIARFRDPHLCVWFEIRDCLSPRVKFERTILALSDGQMFRSHGSGYHSGRKPGNWLHQVDFDVLPVRTKSLHFSTTLGDQKIEFDFKNPSYQPELSAWKSEPLPQTKTRGNLVVTLENLSVEPGAKWEGGFSWRAKPAWSITVDGQNANAWYWIATRYEDPAGNTDDECGLLSEPTWKIRATLKRTDAHPVKGPEYDREFEFFVASPEIPRATPSK